MILSISLFEIINAVTSDSKTFLCIPASAADAATVHSNGIKTILDNGLSTFFIKDKPIFNNGSKRLLRTLPNCTILDSFLFENSILARRYFAES